MSIALLCLSLAKVNGTAGLGPIGAMGIVVAMLVAADVAAGAAGRSSAGGRSGPTSPTSATRALLAPVLLIATVVLSFAAALGFSAIVFDVVFGFPGSDPSFPLLAFIFLVALGVDYNIFLMARVREEALRVGTRDGMLRGLAVTGGGDHVGRHRAGRRVLGAGGAAARLPDRARVRDRLRRAARHAGRPVGLVPALVLHLGYRVWWPSSLSREGDKSGVRGNP